MVNISNIINIKKSKIRLFPLQTRDYSFLLYPDLPSSYLLTLLIDKLGFTLSQFKMDYVYPFKKYVDDLKLRISDDEIDESYFIFSLENYYHSSDYALGFLETILEELSKKKKKPFVVIHSIKTPVEKLRELIIKYDFILLIVNGDIDGFFNDFFHKNIDIKNIGNLFYRLDSGEVIVNESKKVNSELNEYVLGAYSGGYHSYFPKSKDHIISLLDDDDERTNPNIYYRWPKVKLIEHFRYSNQLELMLTTGRGCKYNCSYCYRGVKYSSVRQIGLDIIKKDLDKLKELKYEYIFFYDDCFLTTNYSRIDELTELLSQYDFSYGISTRYEMCKPEILLKLKKINIKRIQVGLQSVSLEVNKDTKRGFNKEKFEETLQNLDKSGIKVSLDLILGLPGEGD